MKFTKSMLALVMAFAGYALFPSSGQAQGKWFGAATYEVSLPTGDAKKFTDATSFRGFGLDFRKSIKPATTVGLFLGWNVFHERINETFPLKIGAVTGVQDRYINYAFTGEAIAGNDFKLAYWGLNAGFVWEQ